MPNAVNEQRLGPAERIIQTLLGYTDHAVHNRPGYIIPDPGSEVRVRWQPVTHKDEEGQGRIVYRMDKVGKKTNKVRLGILRDNNQIFENGRVVGQYRPAGLFPEVVEWMYKKVSEVWQLDNEFAAKWASYAFGQEHKDLKVILAAFMLVQSRKGDPVLSEGKVAFYDDDHRDVGEAMLLLTRKDGKDFNPKLILRVRDVLQLPSVAAMNRALGFCQSQRNSAMGRWTKAATKWLSYRETNPRMLEGLVKAGFRTTVMEIAQRVGFKPSTTKFFEILRWKQKQSKDGRRKMAIGQAVKKAESWEGLNERSICEKIITGRMDLKRVVGFLPKGQGLSQAIVMAMIESGGLSDKDFIIYAPTLEELGLLSIPAVSQRMAEALKKVDDQRAINIAGRMKKTENADALQKAGEQALQTKVAAAMKDIMAWVVIDISGSMNVSFELAKSLLKKFVYAFPSEKLAITVFNTVGRTVTLKQHSEAGVEQAFKGFRAEGGTSYGNGYLWTANHAAPMANQDLLVFFIGDEQGETDFAQTVRGSGVMPKAFGLLKIGSPNDMTVRRTAAALSIPCFNIDERTFQDPYAIPRTIEALVAATPVETNLAARPQMAYAPRQTLVDIILKTDLLQKPAWAA